MSNLTGKKFDGEKVDMDLLSPYALEKIAQVMTYGKTKYGRDNWRGGIVFSRLLAAVLRHINAYRKGETFDPETGLSHLSHASCGLMMLLEFEETRKELDDRFLKDTEQKDEPKKEDSEGVSLYRAAEKAHDDISIMLKKRKIDNAKKFVKGDMVKHMNNDVEVTVEALYYDEQGNPVLFVRDADEKIFGVDPNFYRSIYKGKDANESN